MFRGRWTKPYLSQEPLACTFYLSFGFCILAIIFLDILSPNPAPLNEILVVCCLFIFWGIVGILGSSIDSTKKCLILFFSITCLWLGICLLNTDVRFVTGLKVVGILVFYVCLGLYPSYRWFSGRYGFLTKVILSCIFGSLILNILILPLFLVFEVKIGSWVATILCTGMILYGFYQLAPQRGKPTISNHDWQVVGLILLVLMINVLRMIAEYPHSHAEQYAHYPQVMVNENIFPPPKLESLPYIHFSGIALSAFWGYLLQMDIPAAVYLEIPVGITGFLVLVYILVRELLMDDHSFGLAAAAFVSLYGSLEIFAHLFPLLFSGGNLGILVSSSLPPITEFHGNLWNWISSSPIPFALTNAIDTAKSPCFFLLTLILFSRADKKLLPLLFAGCGTMLFVGTASEEIMVITFGVLFFIFIFHMKEPAYIHRFMIFLLGALFGAIYWFYMSKFSGALNAVGESSLGVRGFSEMGLHMFSYGGGSPLVFKNFGLKSIVLLISIFGLPLLMFLGIFLIRHELRNPKYCLAITLGTLGACLIPIAILPLNNLAFGLYNFNRFVNLFFFWLTILSGLGFAALFRANIFRGKLILPTIILILAMFPTIRWAFHMAVRGLAHLPT